MKTNLIKVPCHKNSQGYSLCVSESLEHCYFLNEQGCIPEERYPGCAKEGIIWLEVKYD